MDVDPIRTFLNEQCLKAAMADAARLEAEAILFMRMGFDAEELTMIVLETGSALRREIWPKLMLAEHD